MTVQLSERFVRTIQPQASRLEIADGTGGLMLIVQAKRADGKPAARSYVWRGRINGAVKKIPLGRAETMKVTDARRKALDITNAVKEGRDPYHERMVEQPVSDATVSEAFTLYMAAQSNRPTTTKEKLRQFEREVRPAIGTKAIGNVTSDDLARLINNVAKRAPTAGNRLQALLAHFFKWSSSSRGRLDTGLTNNPMVGVEKPTKREKQRERYLSAKELGWLLRALKELRTGSLIPRGGGMEMVAVKRWSIALEVLLRTGQRKSDIVDVDASEIDWSEQTITLDGERHKSNSRHVIWVPDQAAKLLKTLPRKGRLFTSMGNSDRCINVIRAKVEEYAAQEGKTVAHWTTHDLRRTFATQLGDMVDEDERPIANIDEIKKILGHSLQGAIAVYLRGDALRMKKRVVTRYNDWLDGLK
jgi:integrase